MAATAKSILAQVAAHVGARLVQMEDYDADWEMLIEECCVAADRRDLIGKTLARLEVFTDLGNAAERAGHGKLSTQDLVDLILQSSH